MPQRNPLPRLTDIIEATTRLRQLIRPMTLEAFEADWQSQWLAERGIEIISEASRHLPDNLKARYPDIPWKKIAGIGNVLRHEYGNIAAAIIWAVIQENLLPLEAACRAEASKPSSGP